jgi:hypothetical protein
LCANCIEVDTVHQYIPSLLLRDLRLALKSEAVNNLILHQRNVLAKS